jgi:hypothetical protein
MAPDALRSANVRPMLSAILFLGSVQLFFALLYVRLSQRIVEEIKRGTPFTDTTSLTLRRLGQITIAASIVIPLLSSAASFGWMKALDLISAVAASPLISGVRMEFEGLNANMLFIGLALLLLSKVFEYGVSLQTQADETL